MNVMYASDFRHVIMIHEDERCGLHQRGLKGCACYDRGGFPGDTLDRVRKYGVNAQELVTTSSTRLLMTT